MMDAKIEKIKAYRKQFEDGDSSFKSFKEPRSDSPSTPKAVVRKTLCTEALVSSSTPTYQKEEEVLLMPTRHQTDSTTMQKN